MKQTKYIKNLQENLPSQWEDDLKMQDVLKVVEQMVPDLLQSEDQWNSMLIDYAPPYLMRLSRKIEITENKSIYINLHYFFSPDAKPVSDIENPYSKKSAAVEDINDLNLYHPHPWAAAFKILKGSYMQKIGLADQLGIENRPSPDNVQEQAEGSSYAFNDPHIWHMVVPPTTNPTPITTLMVTYIPKNWGQKGPKPKVKQRTLTADEQKFMFKKFKTHYPKPLKHESPRHTNTLKPKL